MKTLKSMCCLCLNISNDELTSIFSKRGDDLSYFDRLSSSLYQLPNLLKELNSDGYSICNKCCETIDMICCFNSTCLENVQTYSDLSCEFIDEQQHDEDALVKNETILDTSSNDHVFEDITDSEDILVKEKVVYYNLTDSSQGIEKADVKNECLDQIKTVFLKNQVNKKFSWVSKSTNLMLREYLKRKEHFENPNVKKKTMWDEISSVMLEHGFDVDSYNLDRKMRNLKFRFHRILDSPKYKNKKKIHWEYYKILERIFSNKEKVDDDDTNEICSLQENSAVIDSSKASSVPMSPHPSTSEVLDKFQWDDKSTLLLLDEYKTRLPKFRNPKREKKPLWEEISYAMSKHGYTIDIDNLDRKIRNMKFRYRKTLDRLSKNQESKSKWQYFDTFNDLIDVDQPAEELSEEETNTDQVCQSFVWDHGSIQLMLEEYRKRIDKFRTGNHKKYLYEEMSKVMGEMGYVVDWFSIDRKMRNMKYRYKSILDSKNYKMKGCKTRWEYFDIFDEFFKEEFTDGGTTNADISSTQDSGPSTMQDEISRTHICDVCNEGFLTEGKLTQHMYSHALAKPKMCELCGKSYLASNKLKEHMRSHTGEKPYVCDICGKSFPYKTNFNRHKLIHTGEKPYSCIFCDKRFRLQGDMVKHRRTHTGEEPYSCTICDKKFKVPSSRALHIRMHTREHIYSCEFCPQTFMRSSSAKRHKLKQHKDKIS